MITKADQLRGFKRDSRPKLRPGQRMRAPIRKVGQVQKRYEAKARQPFLLKRYAGGVPDALGHVKVPCDECKGELTLIRTGVGPVRTPGSQVHHVVARGSEPGQREDQSNLRIVHDHCHEIYKYDKSGALWRERHKEEQA